jgi:hypothetical protein
MIEPNFAWIKKQTFRSFWKFSFHYGFKFEAFFYCFILAEIGVLGNKKFRSIYWRSENACQTQSSWILNGLLFCCIYYYKSIESECDSKNKICSSSKPITNVHVIFEKQFNYYLYLNYQLSYFPQFITYTFITFMEFWWISEKKKLFTFHFSTDWSDSSFFLFFHFFHKLMFQTWNNHKSFSIIGTNLIFPVQLYDMFDIQNWTNTPT